jgi:2'-5' RNA ligase
MTSPAILRTFIAIPLPEPVIIQLERIQRRLQRTCPDRCIRWVNPHTIHLTLFFIGDMPETHIEGINQALAATVKTYGTFTFTVADLGTFPNRRRPNVIWVGVKDDEHKLAGLYRAVCKSMAQISFPAESRRFTPHLTIGRVNRRTSRDDRTQIGDEVSRTSVGVLGIIEVSEIVFYRSILKPTGAEHFILEKFPLTE